MEKIISNPGLQHLAENIFWNLDAKDLKICAQINQSCKQILQNPIFCLRKFEHLSKENRKDWIKVIQSVKNSDKGIAIISYLKWNLKKDAFVDLSCYSSPNVQAEFRNKIGKIIKKEEFCNEDMEIVQILAPLTDNPIAHYENGDKRTPIYHAAYSGHMELVKILAPLIDNPNASDKFGNTPIQAAACHGHTEIVRTLASLTDIPNAPNNAGITPIHWAAKHGYTEIVKILAPLTDNINAANKEGGTPIHWAAYTGHIEIVKILAPLTDNPNAPDEEGRTPIHWAATEHMEIVKILAPLTDNPNAPDKEGGTPIHWAAYFGHIEIVEILAQLTDNPNAPDKYCRTPSSVTKNTEIQRFLESLKNTSK